MRESTSDQILAAARQMVQTRGYNAFSYADISERVGIRKASIHYHFPTKANLCQSLAQSYRQEFVQNLQQISESVADPVEQLQGLARMYRDGLSEDRLCLCGMLAADILTLPPEVREEVGTFFNEVETWIAGTLESGAKAGKLKSPGKKAAVEARSLLSGLQGTQLAARAAGWEPEQFDAVADCLIDTVRAA